MKRVVITQRRLTHYRVPLFEGLRSELSRRGVSLTLLHGQCAPDELDKRDDGQLLWAQTVTNHYLRVAGRYLCWQPMGEALRGADLVVITQENRLLSNYPLLLGWRPRRLRVAFWGHGANLQSRHPLGASERFKRWASGRVDWWFAYTQRSAELAAAAGFDRDRITVLNNAIDTSELRRLRAQCSEQELAELRARLELGTGPIAVFLGSLYPDKRLGFLMQAAERIRTQVPSMTLLVIGDGPERGVVEEWTARCSWIRWVGALRGKDKVRHAALGSVMLNPGLVGLGVLDAFAMEVPMATTRWPHHSPEIAYLEDGVNGVVTDDDLSAYASTVAALLLAPERLGALRDRCRVAASRYTIEEMVKRFANGIESALEHTSTPS